MKCVWTQQGIMEDEVIMMEELLLGKKEIY